MATIISTKTSGVGGLEVTGDASGVLQLASNNGTTAVTVDASQNVTFAGSVNAPNTFSFKNRIINGAMQIDQRNAGASVTPASNAYTLDRWVAGNDISGKYSVQRVSDAPSGFSFSAKLTSLSSYTVGSTETYGFFQWIEGFNSADFSFGTASAQTVTLSFWVKSSLTGTFGGSLQNEGYTRGYPFSYTISSANTWEYKTITIAGDTTGTWVGATNGNGLMVYFSVGSGTSRSGTAGAWTGTQYSFGATGAISVVGTNAATWQVTGVQLEKGSTATSFDYRPYGTELALAQRYYQRGTKFTSGYGDTTNVLTVGLQVPVEMRTQPSLLNAADSSGIVANGSLYNLTANSATIANAWFSGSSMAINVTTNAQITRWTAAYGRINDLQLSAEL